MKSLHRQPTRDAYRLTAVCQRWHALILSLVFISCHLPDAIVLQPKKLGYTQLILVTTDPAVHVALTLPCLTQLSEIFNRPAFYYCPFM